MVADVSPLPLPRAEGTQRREPPGAGALDIPRPDGSRRSAGDSPTAGTIRFPNVVIRASAGTGKTFRLAARFLDLLHSGAPADRILATTFTRKAAGEILERILLRLAEAALDERACDELARVLRGTRLTRTRCQDLLQRLTRNLHRLRIGTLDSFFAQLAGSFSLELGLPPGWRIVEELRDRRLRNEAVATILRDETSQEVTRLMHLLTKGEAQRSVSELIRSTVDKLHGLFLETPAEAWQRFPQLAPLSEPEFAQALADLRACELPADRRIHRAHEESLQALLQRDWDVFIQKGLPAKVIAGESVYYKKEIDPGTLDTYRRLLQHVRAELIGQLARQTAATYELLAKFDAVYRRLKYESRALRFDDITRRLATASFGDIERLEFRLDTEIAHLLFDEFQDTSLAQWQVVRPFAERVTHTAGQQSFFFDGGYKSFFCVGDVKQAIYGWRGGKAEIFDAIQSHLVGLRQESLTESHRSSPVVIETVNRIFSRLGQHPNLGDFAEPVQDWSRGFPEHSTARTNFAGYACLRVANATIERERRGEPRTGDAAPGESRSMLRDVAEYVADLVRQSPGHGIGVLTRRNTTVAQMIFELRRLGVSASEEGGNPVIDSPAVELLLSLLRIADHPGNRVARLHVATSPLAAALRCEDFRDDAYAARLAQYVRRRLLLDGYGATIYDFARRLAPACNRRDLSRLQKLVELAYGYQAIATLRPADFVRFVEREKVADPTAASVRVMTVHQAKGLQFDIVVLPELDADLIGQRGACVVGQSDPTQPVDRVCLYRNEAVQALLPDDLQQLFAASEKQTISEALCVLYVATTRAVHALHMLVAPRPNERSLPKTFAGLVRAALTDGRAPEPGMLLFEHGDANWHARHPRPVAAPANSAAPAEPLVVRVAPMPDGRSRGLNRTAPSGLEGGTKVKLSSVFRIDNAAALSRGTLIHAWFEKVRWLEDGRPDVDELRHVAEKLDVSGIDVDDLLVQFLAMLDAPATSGALRRDAYTSDPARAGALRLEVQNERRFAVRDANRLVSGTIDRLVLLYDRDRLIGADVIDYKTDAVSPNDPASLDAAVEHYRPQLTAYRSAVSKIFRIDPTQVSTRLLLVGPDIVKTV